MKTRLSSRLFLCSCVLALCSTIAGQDPGPPAGWTATASLADARHSSCAVRLADGRVLVSGGTGAVGDLTSTELYLAEGSFLPGPRMNSARSQHTCTLLNDGRVLAAGGDVDGTGSAELYDPKANAWQPLAGTGQARHGHTATLLPDGRVLLAGGTGDDPLDSLEIFDPQTNTLARLDITLAEARDQHAAALLADGRVMLIAGRGAQGPLASTEIFNPADSSITAGPPLATARAGHSGTRLDDGRVLVAGGFDGANEIDTAEMFDPDSLAWTPLAVKLNSARRDHAALLIPGNGGILIAGGLLQGRALAATELYLPVENIFLPLGSLTAPRTGLAAAAVDAGMILAAGGLNDNGPQRACGLLLTPAISFTKPLYHPQETAQASGSFFPPATSVKLELALVSGNSVIGANARQLTQTVTTPGNSLNLIVNFPAVPIVLADGTDPGKSLRVTATTAAAARGITAIASVPVKVPTTLTLTLPQPNFEGLNATLTAQLVRPASAQPMTGSVTINAGLTSLPTANITDGTSNTIVFGEGPAPTAVNTSGTSVLVQKGMTNLQPGTIAVTAQYSGDAANDVSTATGAFSVVSKTPLVELSTNTPSPQVGTPFTISAVVKPAGSVATPRILNGTISILQSGFLLGTPGAKFSPNTDPPQLGASLPFTPLTLNPISLSATYAGDAFFRNATSPNITVNVQKATPVLTLTGPPTYQCAQPSNFTATLTFPPALGLSNRSVSVTALAADGSVQSVAPTAPVTLVPSATTLGTATATFSVTLPLDISAVVANFTGDSLLSPAASARGGATPTLQKAPVTVQFVNLPGTVTSPANVTARVTSAACSVIPRGTVEFLDGTQSLAVVPIGLNSVGVLLPFLETSASADANLSISRPVGLHNLQARYSGDAHYSPASSSVAPVVFQ